MASPDIPRPLLKKMSSVFSVPTHQSNDITLQPIKIFIMEMEDVLFHLDSAVMMPETPSGKSSNQGVGDNPDDAAIREEQNRLAGIRAIAAVFKELQFDPTLRVLVTAHADTSASYNFNFELTGLRGDMPMNGVRIFTLSEVIGIIFGPIIDGHHCMCRLRRRSGRAW